MVHRFIDFRLRLAGFVAFTLIGGRVLLKWMCVSEESPVLAAAKKQTGREETGGNISFDGTAIVPSPPANPYLLIAPSAVTS